jgi:selenocysteine-specific elongation factor
VLQQLNQAIIEAVSAAQRSHPDSPELAKELLRTQLRGPLRGLSVRVFDALCAKLISEGSLIAERERLRLPMAVPTVVTDPPQVVAVLSVFLRVGLAAPRLEDLPALLSQQTPAMPPIRIEDLKKIVEQLVRRGDLVRLKDLLFARKAIVELSDRLVAFLTLHREISPSQFKDLVAQSRKYSIPLAEYFDAQRLTLRVGDQRRLRGRT